MSVLFVSVLTMTLFSFKNSGVNEASFKNANANAYASELNSNAPEKVAVTGAVVKTAVKVWQKSSREAVYLTINVVTNLFSLEPSVPEVASNDVKSASLLNAL